jgi:hypothetical protein
MPKNKITITSHAMPNSVYFSLPQCFIKLLKNKRVVITRNGTEINVKEAQFCDYRALSIRHNNQVTYTVFRDKEEVIGEYDYEIDGEVLILYRD